MAKKEALLMDVHAPGLALSTKTWIEAGLLGATISGESITGDLVVNARLDEIERRILLIEERLSKVSNSVAGAIMR